LTKSPTVTVSESATSPSDSRPPLPSLDHLVDGVELLDGERLCWCEHLEGDHLIGEGRCTECGCDGFRADNLEAA
jgi:hypothetical protein